MDVKIDLFWSFLPGYMPFRTIVIKKNIKFYMEDVVPPYDKPDEL